MFPLLFFFIHCHFNETADDNVRVFCKKGRKRDTFSLSVSNSRTVGTICNKLLLFFVALD